MSDVDARKVPRLKTQLLTPGLFIRIIIEYFLVIYICI